MGCKQFKIKPDDPVEKNEADKSVSTRSEVEIVQILTNQSNKSKSNPVVVYRNPLHSTKSLVIQSIISNGPDEFAQHLPPIVCRTPVKSSKSDDYHYATNSDTLSKSGKRTPHTNLDSDISDIPEHSSITLTSDHSYLICRPGSSSTTGAEKLAHRKDAMNRFMSGRPNRTNTHQESTRNNAASESDECYSLSLSSASGISADSEGSAINQPIGVKNTHIHPKQSNLQSKTFIDETTSESDVSELQIETVDSSAVREVQMMKEHLETVLRKTSTKLSTSDFNQRGNFSETTSEAEDL